jgi:predicted O-methyltransferase YrrM
MSLKYQILRKLPIGLHYWLLKASDRRKLAGIGKIACDTSALRRSVTLNDVQAILASPEWEAEWEAVDAELKALGGATGPGSVNLGENRALYILARALKVHSILEVGTNTGASTVHLVAALRANCAEDGAARMVSVDILDQNGPDGTATRLGQATPRAMIERMGAGEWVRFVAEPSLNYLLRAEARFDMIFLDGDHAAPTVYKEIPASLRVLNPGGVILLHDYFPGGKSLYRDRKIIAGPWLAAQRLKREGAAFQAIPLGELPWETKMGSNLTVLAAVVGC